MKAQCFEMQSIEALTKPLNDVKLFKVDSTNANFWQDFQPNSINYDGIFIKNCHNFQTFTNFLTKAEFFNNQASPLFLRLDILDIKRINQSEVQKYIKKFNKKIFLISFENHSNHEKSQIFWKFKSDKIFFLRVQKEFSSFVVNFLASSMTNIGHCGVPADFLSSLQSNETILEVDKLMLRNSNGLNLLMIAAELGNLNAVNLCLKSGFNVNEKVNGSTAVDLAWKNQHFELVLDLLNANSQFPVDFEVSLATEEVIKFVDVTMELQSLILDANFHKIEEVLKQHQNLRHFYSTQNISAPTFALLNGKFETYEFLIANNVYIGPDEKMDEILKHISSSCAENIEEIHQKYLKTFKENHLMILTGNSFVGHEVPNIGKKMSLVRKAFKYLDQVHTFVSHILQTVAASRDFRIIFDFEQHLDQFLDVAEEQRKRNLMYSLRTIYIPAADMLVPGRIVEAYGTIAHDICLLAMHLVYRNYGCPYYSHEKYANSHVPFKMEECQVNFPDLTKFSCQSIVHDMQFKIPLIQKSLKEPGLSSSQIKSRFTTKSILLIALLPFIIWLSTKLIIPYIEPIYSCRNLTDDLRLNIFESNVEFQGINVIFGDLFGRNLSACDYLSTQEVTEMLKRHEMGTEAGAKKAQMNLAQKEPGELKKIIFMESKLRNSILKIHKMQNLTSKFYIERNLIYSNANNSTLTSKPLKFSLISSIKLLFLSDKGGSGKSTYFRHMAWKLKRRFPLKWISYVDLKQHIHVLQDVPKIDENLTTVVDFLSSKLLNLTSKLEIEVFKKKFLSNETALLWDGIDEVGLMDTLRLDDENEAELTAEFVDVAGKRSINRLLDFFKIISRLTDNKQWIAARPNVEDMIYYKLMINALCFIRFDEDDRKKFMEGFGEAKNRSDMPLETLEGKYEKFVGDLNKKIKVFSKNDKEWISFDENLAIFEIVCDQLYSNIESNLYTIYEQYNHQILSKTLGLSQNDPLWSKKFNQISKVLQHFAVTMVVKVSHYDPIYADIVRISNWMKISSNEILNFQEILRLGIAYKNGDSFLFEDELFFEFFVSHAFFQKIWNLKDEKLDTDEAEFRLRFLFIILYKASAPYNKINAFIAGFTEAYENITAPQFHPAIRSTIEKHFFHSLSMFSRTHIIKGSSNQTYETIYTARIEMVTKFFKKDRKLLQNLWKINENHTYFHKILELVTVATHVEDLTRIVTENFNIEDQKKIFHGKFQNAYFLSNLWKNRWIDGYANAVFIATGYSFDIKKLQIIKNLEDFIKFLPTQNFSYMEIREFFYGNIKLLIKEVNFNMSKIYAKELLNFEDYKDIIEEFRSKIAFPEFDD